MADRGALESALARERVERSEEAAAAQRQGALDREQFEQRLRGEVEMRLGVLQACPPPPPPVELRFGVSRDCLSPLFPPGLVAPGACLASCHPHSASFPWLSHAGRTAACAGRAFHPAHAVAASTIIVKSQEYN